MKDTQAIFSAMLESKKTDAKSKVIRKVESTKRFKTEAEDAPEEFNGTLVKAQSEQADDTVMDDVINNIQVVTDPEKTVDELEERADEIQDAIEGSPEGEEAFSDEYVGDKVYACPICGESFFADEDYSEGDACPICKAEPTDGFLLQGVVAPCEDCTDDEEPTDTGIEADIPEEDEEELPEGFDDIEEPEKSESVKRPRGRLRKEGKLAPKKECDGGEEIEVTIDLDDNKVEIEKERKTLDVELDENSFEDNLNQFAEENYGGAIDDIKVTDASYNPKDDELCLDCMAECKNGSKVPMQFRMKESRVKGNRAVLLARESKNAFKVESKRPAFSFQVVNQNGTIRCESMKYSFITTHSKAGKVQVEGYCRSKKRTR